MSAVVVVPPFTLFHVKHIDPPLPLCSLTLTGLEHCLSRSAIHDTRVVGMKGGGERGGVGGGGGGRGEGWKENGMEGETKWAKRGGEVVEDALHREGESKGSTRASPPTVLVKLPTSLPTFFTSASLFHPTSPRLAPPQPIQAATNPSTAQFQSASL